jgi:hypothetical protein
VNSGDKIEIALRAGIVAGEVLKLQTVSGKLLAKLLLNEVAHSLMELDKKINSLPED